MRVYATLTQNFEPLFPLTIPSGKAISYAFPLTLIDGVGGRGFALGLLEAGWDAADLIMQVSDDANVVTNGGTDDLKSGTFLADGVTNANWYQLEDKTGALLRITSIPTTTTSLKHVRNLHPEAWAAGVWKFLRFVSINTASTATVNQTANRTIYIKTLF